MGQEEQLSIPKPLYMTVMVADLQLSRGMRCQMSESFYGFLLGVVRGNCSSLL
jgi:hypothetical protein